MSLSKRMDLILGWRAESIASRKNNTNGQGNPPGMRRYLLECCKGPSLPMTERDGLLEKS